MSKPIWVPSPERVSSSNIVRFQDYIAPRVGHLDFDALHDWSVSHPAEFWSELWDFAGVIGDKGEKPWLTDAGKMPGAKFFPTGKLNYAENLLRYTHENQELVFWGEGRVKSRMPGQELRDGVARMQRFLTAKGVVAKDRVAAVMPNMPQSIVAVLGTASIGAVWSSCSPDFGVQGLLDRFTQIDPKVLVVCDGYYYNGKAIDLTSKIGAILSKLPTVEHVLVVGYLGDASQVAARLKEETGHASVLAWDDALAPGDPVTATFERYAFDHPLFVLFSSGTTGVPKCIVHSAGGLLLKHLSEHILHTDIKPNDRVFYFTTLGWMMWNWLVSGLATGASLLLFDGSPTYPNAEILWRFAERERCTHFGTSAKYIDTLKKLGLGPGHGYDVSALRCIMSTGSPLSAGSYDYVYHAIKGDVHLASISGGTDICGCFVLGNPTRPVWRGEIQGPALGLSSDVADDAGNHMESGKGELVCRGPFPSMPIGFWNDPDGARYRAAYFGRFPGIWHHGDFAEWTENGGIIIHGRSDATLNPGGVRIGTAEIYRVVETIPQIQEAVAIGQEWLGDVRVLLFVVLKDANVLDDDLVKLIKSRIKDGASPRHVPALVIPVSDIPRTRSGKISELAVRDTVMGRAVNNTEALANPEALEHFKAAAWSHFQSVA